MSENTKLSGARNLFFTSPFILLVFLVVPVYTVVGLRLHLPVSGTLLFINNVCFLAVIALRLVRCLLKMRSDIRYGADLRLPTSMFALDRPASALRGELTRAGYRFDAGSHYGEKRDLGYLGTTLLYGGLLVLLLTGSYDYMRQYSVMARLGVGEPVLLDNLGLAGEIEAGVLGTARLPMLQVRKQILPNQQWPQGATEIALLSKDRKELAKSTIAPDKPFRYRGLDYHMTRFVFDALIMVRERQFIVYENFVKFLPLAQKKGVYSYYGTLPLLEGGKVRGSAWLNPEKKAVRVEATLDGKKIVDTELELWGKNKETQGDYLTSLNGLAQWTEIRIARGRHRAMLLVGAAFAIFGGFMRLIIRPQRVWLEEAETGCRVRATGGKTLRFLGHPDKQ